MLTRSINIGESKLEYFVFNEEVHQPILCFHGFDQSGDVFEIVAQENPERKVVGISLFHHGKSVLGSADSPLSDQHLKLFISTLLEQEGIKSFDLSGYSLGTRYAVSTYRSFSTQVQQLYLVAPDGLIRNFWFQMATFNKLFRRAFHWFTHSPDNVSKLVNALGSLKLIKPGLLKFTQKQLSKPGTQLKVYNAWISSYKLKMTQGELDKLSKMNGTLVHFVLADKDPVITKKSIEKIASGVHQSSLTILAKTHLQLGNINFLNPEL